MLSYVLCLGFSAGCKPADPVSTGRTVRLPPRAGNPAVMAPVMGTAGGTAGAAVPTAGMMGAAGGGGGAGVDVGMPQAGGGSMVGMPQAGMAGMPAQPPAMRTFNAGSDPARNMVQPGKVCSRLAQIQCAGEAFCCDNPGRDIGACETAQTELCVKELYVDAISLDSRAGFDAARAATALQTFEEMASRCDPNIGEFGTDPEGLLAMVRGTVDANGRCSPGVTTNEARAAGALASCRNSATTACLPMSALNWVCTARGGPGSGCFTDLNCTDGNFCPNPDAEIGMHRCEARKMDGASCQLPNECMSLTCTGGRCAPATTQSAYCLK